VADRCLVATRKGLFIIGRRADAIWRVVATAFLGSPVSMALWDPRTDAIYAALALGHFGVKLHRSTDRGAEWTEIATPAFPKQPEAATDAESAKAPSVELIWTLAAAGTDAPGVIWAGTIPGGLFRSADAGESWSLIRSLWQRPERARWFGGGYDHPGIHSICVDPRGSDRVAVAVSSGGVWLSEDGGESWATRSQGMVAEYMPPDQRHDPAVQDPHRLVQCLGQPNGYWVQHHCGVYRSTDDLATWQAVSRPAVSRFGFAVAVHPRDPDTAWLVPALSDEARYPVDGKLVVTRTRDGGDSFDVLRQGLPQEPAYDLIYRHGLDVDQGGERLFMGSTSGALWISEDAGDHWTCLSAHLPPIYCVRAA
jgi:hypothetical protein